MIILPGGNDLLSKDKISKIRLKVEFKMIKYGIKKNIPILGVCRGMQVINFFLKVSKLELMVICELSIKFFLKINFFSKNL